jgi:glycosidase
MPTSVFHGPKALDAFAAAAQPSRVIVDVPLRGRVAVNKPFASPPDWRDQMMYLIMVDRFNNPDAPPPPDWDRKRTGDNERFGGTFEGIRQKLDYLAGLGVGAIWMTPVLKNRMSPSGISHHGYGIYDFMEVDPRFASDPSTPGLAEQELIRLVDEAHARGMYVILDIVINHAGDIFEYREGNATRNEEPWSNREYDVCWRDRSGAARLDLPVPRAEEVDVGPTELLGNENFRRHGRGGFDDWCKQGDFCTLKELATDREDVFHDRPVLNALIRSYQYLIALTDVDGFRIDTLKFVEEDCARTFCNAIREYAYLIGKKNFFMFGESKTSNEEVLARYTGRNTAVDDGDVLGADAQIDFPLCWKLGSVVKGFEAPTAIIDFFQRRREAQRNVISSHGEASKYFVTNLDCHDDEQRFLYPRDGGDYTGQLTLALGCLLTLQGIPCIYYGTEVGLKGTQEIYAPDYRGGGCPEFVREALWGAPGAFATQGKIYRQLQAMAAVRAAHAPLRYGRQYFREISGNGGDFGYSQTKPGIIAFSRILNDREVLVVANTSLSQDFTGQVIVDARINSAIERFKIAHSNRGTTGEVFVQKGNVRFYNRDNSFRDETWACRVPLALRPAEFQILLQKV